MLDLPSYIETQLKNALKDKTLYDSFIGDLALGEGNKKRLVDFKEKVLALGEIDFLLLLEENSLI